MSRHRGGEAAHPLAPGAHGDVEEAAGGLRGQAGAHRLFGAAGEADFESEVLIVRRTPRTS